MEDIIIMQDGLPIFNSAYKTIPAFKNIIVRARKQTGQHTSQIDLATRQLAYVWFMEDYRSNFKERFPDNEEERDKIVRKRLQLEDWDALKDDLILEARTVWREDNETIEMIALEAALIAAQKIVLDFKSIALTADPSSKNLAKSPAYIIKACKELDETIKNLRYLKQEAKKSTATNRIAGNKSKSVFEDPTDYDRTRKKAFV